MTLSGSVAGAARARRPVPLVFLSSTVRGVAQERRELAAYADRYGQHAMWVDEIYREQARRSDSSVTDPVEGTTLRNPFHDIDDYLRELRRSTLYVAWIPKGRSGSPIRPEGGGEALATFFEIELAYAAALGRPITIVRVRGVEPEPALAYLLNVVSRTLRVEVLEAESVHEATRLLRRVIDEVAAGQYDNVTTDPAQYGAFLADRWKLRDASLRWLSNDWPRFENHPLPDRSVIDACLRDLSTVRTNEQRLARLWVAAREVMCAPYWEPEGSEWLPMWNQVLAAWNSAAAWYGLHGHLELGYLAALNSLADVRRVAVLQNPARLGDPKWDQPDSARASAYYAVAHRVSSKRLRWAGLWKAHGLLRRARPRDPRSEANTLAIMGSVQLQMGNVVGGLRSYRRVVRLREANGASQAEVGEALSELGYAYARIPGLRRRGVDLLRTGVAMMREGGSDPGFMVRATYKLSEALGRRGAKAESESARLDALAMAQEHTVGTAARDYSNPDWRRDRS